MRTTRCLLICALALAPLAAAPATAQEPAMTTPRQPTGFLDRVVDTPTGSRRYVVYVPFDYTPERAWPLILFFHGSGERGDDGLIQSEVGIGEAIRRHSDRYPAIVVMPQCPPDRVWDAAVPAIEGALAQTEAEFNIDPKRRYLTGLSMGGYMVWVWGAVTAERWAALAPICGGGKMEDMKGLSKEPIETFGTLEERVQKLATLPIWTWHGMKDMAVLPARTQQMVRLVKEAGGKVRHTEVEEAGHQVWEDAYADEAFARWLFRQEKKD